MLDVALIVTGELERLGLAEALTRVFPDARFRVEMRLDSFTSARVRSDLRAPTGGTPRLVDKLAAALAATVDPGRRGVAADYALVIEDLELANLDQPDVVVSEFRDAVSRHIDQRWSGDRGARSRKKLRERASFHLLAPMLEAYFFGEPASLEAAGITATPQLESGVDLEAFSVVDPPYLSAAPGSASWAVANRHQHPKRYLEYLLGLAGGPDPRYRETIQGRAALLKTNFLTLIEPEPGHLRFARSLLHDLALALDQPLPAGIVHPATARSSTVLRNA
jgi:hypothetical protein